jgi:hypothetical protein
MSKRNPKTGKLQMSRRKKLLFAGFATLFGITLLEGFATWFAVGSDLVKNWKQPVQVGVLSEERHCEYDNEFGWANKPETVIADFYGPGRTISVRHFKTLIQKRFSWMRNSTTTARRETASSPKHW